MVPSASAQTSADGYYAVTYVDVATTAAGQGRRAHQKIFVTQAAERPETSNSPRYKKRAVPIAS